MVGFNTTAICIKGTQSVQRACNSVLTDVQAVVIPVETTVIVVASAIILWHLGYEVYECRKMRIQARHHYEMIPAGEGEGERQAAPASQPVNKQTAARINRLIHTLAFMFVVGQLVFFYDTTRRIGSPQNCIPVNDYAMKICAGILNATYHAVIPSGLDAEIP
jgi:hypothetical protein